MSSVSPCSCRATHMRLSLRKGRRYGKFHFTWWHYRSFSKMKHTAGCMHQLNAALLWRFALRNDFTESNTWIGDQKHPKKLKIFSIAIILAKMLNVEFHYILWHLSYATQDLFWFNDFIFTCIKLMKLTPHVVLILSLVVNKPENIQTSSPNIMSVWRSYNT